MNHLAASSALVLIASTSSLIIILFYKPRNNLKNIWGIFNLSVILWSFGTLKYSISLEYYNSLFWWRFSNLSGLFIGVLMFHFALILTNKAKDKHHELYIWYFLTLTITATSLIFPSLYIPDIEQKFSLYFYANPGILYHFWPFQFSTLVICTINLLIKQYQLTTDIIYKNQLKYVAIGMGVGGLGGGTLFFSNIQYQCSFLVQLSSNYLCSNGLLCYHQTPVNGYTNSY